LPLYSIFSVKSPAELLQLLSQNEKVTLNGKYTETIFAGENNYSV